MTRPALWETVLAASMVVALLAGLEWLRTRPITGEERFPATSSGPATSTPTLPHGPGARLHHQQEQPR